MVWQIGVKAYSRMGDAYVGLKLDSESKETYEPAFKLKSDEQVGMRRERLGGAGACVNEPD